MKNYVVAIISLFDNKIKQFKITAENDFEAVKKSMIDFCESEEGKKDEFDVNKIYLDVL